MKNKTRLGVCTGEKMTQNRKKMADLGEWGVCPPLQNRILGKNVISHDSPGIVKKKNRGEKIERGVLKSET